MPRTQQTAKHLSQRLLVWGAEVAATCRRQEVARLLCAGSQIASVQLRVTEPSDWLPSLPHFDRVKGHDAWISAERDGL
jgi:hypothetical protein